MAVDFFLDIQTKKGGKVKGEVTTKDPKELFEQIAVKRFSVGITSPTDFATGAAAGRVHLEHAEFEFPVGSSSTPLFQTICNNDMIKTATLSCRKAGVDGKQAIYMQLRFNNARLVSYRITGAEENVGDAIRIAYSGIEITYNRQKGNGLLEAKQWAAYSAQDNAMVNATLGQ